MTEFLKQGNKISPKPQGSDYSLEKGKLYMLKFNSWSGESYFEEDGEMNLNFKIYNSDEDTMFMDRVLRYHNKTDKLSTGVMLAGLKGTGKTVMAKQIAKNSDLPIIVVDPDYPASRIGDFFTKFSTEVCVIFDEIDKNWNSNNLLGFLDGVQKTAKKLVLFTCNDLNKTSEFLKDRCSRVRFRRIFAANENVKFLKELIADKGIDDKNDELYNFMVNHFEVLSIDNILSFIEEKVMYPDMDNSELIRDMNISTKNLPKKGEKKADGKKAKNVVMMNGKPVDLKDMDLEELFGNNVSSSSDDDDDEDLDEVKPSPCTEDDECQCPSCNFRRMIERMNAEKKKAA